MSLLKNTKVLILIFFLVVGALILLFSGLKYGLDFSGGTEFVITLDKEISADEMSKVTSTIGQRLDWTGLKDVKVSSFGGKNITAQVAVSDPVEVAKIEEILQKQGKFENIYNGEILFTGDDVIAVLRDASEGYGIGSKAGGYEWSLPFMLNVEATRNFAEGIFHKCITLPDNKSECPQTYFFIDRPVDSLLLIPKEVFGEEQFTSSDPIFFTGEQVKIDDILKNAKTPYVVVSEFDANTIAKIKEVIEAKTIEKILYHSDLNIEVLKDLNLGVSFVKVIKQENLPWIWTVTGLKSIISVTLPLTNPSVSTIDSLQFKVFPKLVISGFAKNLKEAQEKIGFIDMILSSGALPVGVDSISKETIPPQLGHNILSKILLAGLIALILVAIVLFLRYKNWQIMFPIFITGASEVFLILAFASAIKWNLDLAALAGVLAAVGTGVDYQIIITDEISKSRQKEDDKSLVTRVKRAFFIIFVTMAVTLATMLPVLFGFYGISKFVGFAIVTIAGVLIGVFITRPAYAEILKYIYSK